MNKIILALDTTNLEEAINVTNQIKDKIFTVGQYFHVRKNNDEEIVRSSIRV